MSLQNEAAATWIGRAVPRWADERMVRGQATYLDDLPLEAAHVAIVRSPYAHARILRVDTSAAERAPGVLGVVTGEDILKRTRPVAPRAITEPVLQYVMAVGKVRYVGEPVVLVAATDLYAAEDAAALVDVDYEPLPVVSDLDAALAEGAPRVFEEASSNVLLHDHFVHGDVERAFRTADLVVEEQFCLPRYSSTPLETWAIAVEYHADRDAYTVWSNDQQPGRTAINVSDTLGVSQDRLRFIVPESGGGFGIKLALWPYITALAVLARIVGRRVKWVQTRSEHLLAGAHTPEARIDAALALKQDGTVTGLRITTTENDGSFIHTAGIYSLIKFSVLVGCYRIPATSFEFYSVVTNRCPTVQNRGVGKPGMIFVVERMMERAARRLGVDAIELRRRNFITPDQMPYTTPSGETYESGDYPECLNRALELADYSGWIRKRDDARARGRYIGVGVACGIEPGTSNLGYYYMSRDKPEFVGNVEGAMVWIDFDGHVNVVSGSVDSGQGHATTVAQVLADRIGIHPRDVSFAPIWDSAVSPFVPHSGTYANRFNDVELGAIVLAADRVKAKMERIARFVLDEEDDDLVFTDGRVQVAGDPGRSTTIAEIANYAYKKPLLLPEDIEPGLREIAYYQNRSAKIPRRDNFNIQLTHSNAAHVVIVEVDLATGFIELLDYTIVHDCGRQLNPGIVDGMVIGSTVHGIGASLFEEFVYDSAGQLLTGTFMDYLKPLPMSLPRFRLGHMESLCPTTPLGTKGVGEGGAITSLPAIANAVEDALAPYGVKVTSLPITPEKVLRALTDTKEI